jgi:hypothetical protein
MSEPKIIDEIVCPDCDHPYGYVFDDEEANAGRRRNAECPCGTGMRVERPIVEAPRGPQLTDGLARKNAENPYEGPRRPEAATLLRVIEHHSKLCGNDCTECAPKEPAPSTGRNSSVSSNQDVVTPEGFVAYDVDGRRGFVTIGHLVRYPESARAYGLNVEYFESLKKAEEEEAEEEELEGENGRLCTPSSWNF